MTVETHQRVPFEAHVELLQWFLAHRAKIVDRIQDMLNAQRRPVQYLQDRNLLSRLFEDCFFGPAAGACDFGHLRGQLEEAHWANGFRPRAVSSLHNDLIHPAEMMMRGFFCWHQTRWPGRNGRVRYAETLFNVYLLRCLELLSMRLWDAGDEEAPARLGQVQSVLDALWACSPTDQPAFVRDARWLIPLAQSPTTDDLAPYFEVAANVAGSLPEADRIEIQKAAVMMIGGHLRSQIRHYCLQDSVPLNDSSVVLRTRTSNALDFALLIQALVPLLDAYENAVDNGAEDQRLELADAICQAISPDPDLFVNRVDLLAALSMIEHLFVATDDDGRAHYTKMGERHVDLVRQYAAKIGPLTAPLHDDCIRYRPVDGGYSPYGAIFGTPSNLTEHMALKALQSDAIAHFGLEDAFVSGDADSGKLEWVNGWRNLPHIPPEIQRQHDYPQRFAVEIFERIEQALQHGASGAGADERCRTGRICVASEDDRPDVPTADPTEDLAQSPAKDLPIRYIGSSDPEIVGAGKAEAYDHAQLLRDRFEGHFALSYQTSGGWVAISKNMLTDVIGAGHDTRIAGLPRTAAAILELTCPGIAIASETNAAAAAAEAEADANADDQANTPPSILKA